jgi:hypothetical protein
MTQLAEMPVSISTAKASRLKSSITLKVRKRRFQSPAALGLRSLISAADGQRVVGRQIGGEQFRTFYQKFGIQRLNIV